MYTLCLNIYYIGYFILSPSFLFSLQPTSHAIRWRVNIRWHNERSKYSDHV